MTDTETEAANKEKTVNKTETMPSKIAAAISAVMAEVPKLEKGEKNTHGNYNFASIDDFLEALRPICSGQGLAILQNEEEFGSDGNMLSMRFRFTLMHSSGEVWDGGCRSIIVSAKMGAQAFGAAQSYALKQYMRSLFMVSTGEKSNDVDEMAAYDLPKAKGSSVRRAAAPVAAAPVADSPDKAMTGDLKVTALKAAARALSEDMGLCTDHDMLTSTWESQTALLEQMESDLPDWHEKAAEKYAEMQERFAIAEAV